MDRKTLTEFLALTVLILAAWGIFYHFMYAGKQQPQPAPAPARQAAAQAQAPPPAQPAPQGQAAAAPEGQEAPAQPAAGNAPAPAPAEQIKPVDVKLENKHLQMTWTNVGAALRTLVLLDKRYRAPYYDKQGKRPPLTLLDAFQPGMLSDTVQKVTFVTHTAPGAPAVRKEVPTADLPYKVVEQGPDHIVFEGTVRDDPDNPLLGKPMLAIRKTVSVKPDAYQYGVSLELTNVSGAPYEVALSLRGAAGIERESLSTRYLGTRVAVQKGPGDYKIIGRSAHKLDVQDRTPNESSRIAWAAVVNHYFVAILRPEDSEWVSNVASDLIEEQALVQASGRWDTSYVRGLRDRRSLAKDATVVIHTEPLDLAPGGSVTKAYTFFTAPKAPSLLAAYGAGADGLIEFGWFGAISRVAVVILNAIHAVLPNYGIAIVILTALVRLMLHPLTRKQQIGMIKMQKLQPQIAELQRKFPDDKQAQTREQMALYQKYGVHPLSGCGPMLLQLPVLIALYRALGSAIQLRHAGFLWINDLSRPDTIYHFSTALPFLQDQLNLLPIIMTAVMFWQQKTMPTPTSEQAQQQQKMMKWMPLMFVFFFYHMSSGLVLYWTLSSAIGIFERWLINRKAASIELKPVGASKRRGRNGAAGKGRPEKNRRPTWLERLQKMAEQQTDAKGRKKKLGACPSAPTPARPAGGRGTGRTPSAAPGRTCPPSAPPSSPAPR